MESRTVTPRKVDASKLVPLCDADILVYRVGFAAEKDEPIENVLHSVKLVLRSMTEPFNSKMRRLFLTGKGNFRSEVAKTLEYKGNRKDTPKPQYYQEIRDYLMNVHGAEMINFQEADDAMGIEQMKYKGSSVIVSIDKDMRMIPGWHYNFVKQRLDYVTKDEANWWFFRQLLTGDMTDNIKGVPGMGPKTAEKLLGHLVGDTEAMQRVAIEQYRKAYGEETWQSVHDEMAQLLWIRRKEDELCPYLLRTASTSTSMQKESESTTSPTSDGESKTESLNGTCQLCLTTSESCSMMCLDETLPMGLGSTHTT